MLKIKTLCFVVLFIMLLSSAAVSNNVLDGYSPLDAKYGTNNGLSSEYSFDDIIFVDPADRPAIESLTDEERYILAGAQADSDNVAILLPWHLNLSSIALKAFDYFGYVPSVLTPDIIRQIPDFEYISDSTLDYLRNPLTGAWPRLDSMEHSPGNAYIRPLTKEEMIHLANNIILLKKSWFENTSQNPSDLHEGKPYMDCFTLETELASEVFYVRIYGWDGVIYTNLLWETDGERPEIPDTNGEIVTVDLTDCNDCNV